MMKRFLDVVISFAGIIFFIPFWILVSIWIKLDSPGPVFYRQERFGLNGKIFLIFKFRSMYLNSEELGLLSVAGDQRTTKAGRFLRKYKIDEFPQLINVFFGEMSLVGPRPEVREFFYEYSPYIQNKILSVRPGITDLASLEMIDENEILKNYEDPKKAYIEHIMPIKQTHYIEYVENNNFRMDIYIIFSTIKKIIFR